MAKRTPTKKKKPVQEQEITYEEMEKMIAEALDGEEMEPDEEIHLCSCLYFDYLQDLETLLGKKEWLLDYAQNNGMDGFIRSRYNMKLWQVNQDIEQVKRFLPAINEYVGTLLLL